MTRMLLLAVALGFATTALTFAQNPAPAAAEDTKVVKTAATKSTPVATVPFRKALGLPYPSLGTLGTRIDAARRSGDPVALAHAASELSVAEKVSGKKASVTSAAIMKEAAELASLRKQVAELKAVQQVSEKVLVEQEQADSLTKAIDFAQTQTAVDQNALKANQEPTDAPRKLVVNNYSTQYVDVQVNGYLKGQVPPGSQKTFTIDQMWNPVSLKGYGDEDTNMWGPVWLPGKWSTYTWNITGETGAPTLP
jgi:hypothetical protein